MKALRLEIGTFIMEPSNLSTELQGKLTRLCTKNIYIVKLKAPFENPA